MAFRFVLLLIFVLGSLVAACGTDVVESDRITGVGAEPTASIVEPTITAAPPPPTLAPIATLEPKATARPRRMPTPTPITITESVDSAILKDELVALGAVVEIVGHVKFNGLFGRWPSELTVNGQAVRIYEFETPQDALIASETVSSGGYTFTKKLDDDIIQSVILEWVESPHFYLFSNSIILYFGEDGAIGELLDLVGTKFAGRLLKTDEGFDWVVVPAVVNGVRIRSRQPDHKEYVVSVFLVIGQCEEKDGISMERIGEEFHFEATKRVADPPTECIGESFNPGESFDVGSDFEAGVEYRVIVNGDLLGSFIAGVPKIPDY